MASPYVKWSPDHCETFTLLCLGAISLPMTVIAADDNTRHSIEAMGENQFEAIKD